MAPTKYAKYANGKMILFSPLIRITQAAQILRASMSRGRCGRRSTVYAHEERLEMTKLPAPVTAAELSARLAADPDYLARREIIDKAAAERAVQYRIEEAPVVEALREAGVEVDSVWDLVNTAKPYPKAIPVLLEELGKPYSSRVREGIARALSVRDAKAAWPILVEKYRKEPNLPGNLSGAKDGLAVALSATVTNDTIDELIALAKDVSHGSTRLLLLHGIRRSRTPQAKRAIEELASDPQLAKEIASWRKRKND